MELSISIDQATCIKCAKCVKVCPAYIIEQNTDDKTVDVVNQQLCIVCGHCVGVCPTDSVIHSEFPANKVHEIDRSMLPSPEQMMLLIKSRRSNRAFRKTPVPAELLDQILEAAHRAPTASNKQQVEFTLVTDPEKIKQVIGITIDVFSSIERMLRRFRFILRPFMPDVYKLIPVFQKLKDKHNNGEDPILRGFNSLILIHTPETNMFGAADCNLAYQNASLMAESLGVSQIYTGYLCTAIGRDKKKRIEKLFGITGKIHAGMALALPQFPFRNYIDKKDIAVTKF